MEKMILDYVLVPVGLLVMVVYHMWLLRQISRRPATTVLGVNAANRRLWVRAMMEDTAKNGILAVQTLRNNIMASTLLATMSIMLSSVIAVLMSGGSGSHGLIYRDNSKLGFSLKFFSIQVCFLSAFLLYVQSIRYYSHASMLINVPNNIRKEKNSTRNLLKDYVTVEYVSGTVNRGSHFWSLGLRAFYFSLPLFLWIFGPIPMFLCCVLLVFLLYFLDVILDSEPMVPDHDYRQEEGQQVPSGSSPAAGRSSTIWTVQITHTRMCVCTGALEGADSSSPLQRLERIRVQF
ncbi:hypothetical protein OROGR_010931 [Orobanche gracilis]